MKTLKRFALFFIAPLAVAMTLTAADNPCEGYWNTNGEIVLFPNPNNCREAFECIGYGDYRVLWCPEGLWFCPNKGTCSWTWDPDCTYDCTDVD